MKSGIYAILNIKNNKIYIGQSKNVKARINRHKSELKHNKHKNIYLQREINKYGFENFEFNIIEYCNVEELDEKEKNYIKQYNSTDNQFGFNLTDGGENTKWNDEARKRRSGKGNPQYGKHLSKKHLEAVRIANLGTSDKLEVKDVEKIKLKLINNEDLHSIAKEYKVEYSTIHKIFCIKNWAWVSEELNEKLIELRNSKTENIKNRNLKIVECFDNGMSRKEIMGKLNLTKDIVNRVIRKQANTEVN